MRRWEAWVLTYCSTAGVISAHESAKASAQRPSRAVSDLLEQRGCLVLLASAALALVLGEVADGLVVAAVVLLNALIGFFQRS
jgi:magnesium-transporting ATPase (P-type)